MDAQPSTDDWPVVPPAPTPIRPGKLLPRPTPDVRLIPPVAGAAVPATQEVTALPPRPRPRRPQVVRSTGASVVALRRATPRAVRTDELVWQPRFAYGAASAILALYTLVTLPVWIVVYRRALGATPDVPGLLALVMTLLGGLLVAAAAWIILVEMRGRERMVDTLARSGEFGVTLPAPTRLPTTLTTATVVPTASIAARVRERLNAAAANNATERVLGTFSGVLRSYSQRGAQLGLLAVALVLFLGATILSLH